MDALKTFGELVYSYTRSQAITDGVLVDLTQIPVIRQQWRHPLACTYTVWAIIKEAAEQEGNDLNSLLHDVSTMAQVASRVRGARTDTVRFRVILGRRHQALKIHVGPGDTPKPVLTLMLPDED
jgi:hypothetical protein